MAVTRRIAFLLLMVTSTLALVAPAHPADASLVTVTQDANGSEAGGPQEGGCVNIVLDNWGSGSLPRLYPYTGDAIGFAVSEDAAGSGETVGVIIVPSLCNSPAAPPLPTGQVLSMNEDDALSMLP